MEQTSNNKKSLDESIKWHFFNLYCMALSDTVFDPKEAELLYKLGLENGLDKQTIDDIVLTSGLNPEYPKSIEEKVSYLYDLTRMAWADGKIVEEEKELLLKNILKFGFKEENKDAILKFFIDSVKNSLSLEEIVNKIKS